MALKSHQSKHFFINNITVYQCMSLCHFYGGLAL